MKKNIDWKIKKKEKENRKMVKSQITTIILFLLLIFYIEKFILFRKNIWKNLVYIITFVLQFFCVAGFWNAVMKYQHPFSSLAGAVFRHKILGNRLGIR